MDGEVGLRQRRLGRENIGGLGLGAGWNRPGLHGCYRHMLGHQAKGGFHHSQQCRRLLWQPQFLGDGATLALPIQQLLHDGAHQIQMLTRWRGDRDKIARGQIEQPGAGGAQQGQQRLPKQPLMMQPVVAG
jgi:hypothetical protein